LGSLQIFCHSILTRWVEACSGLRYLAPQRRRLRWRDLCWEAMHEKDVNKLLMIFLELDRATEGKQLMEVFTETVREYRQIGSEEKRAN
jgi:hypothetical protein